MKHGLFKRSLSMVLALVMILGNLPLNALATETEETTVPACEHSYEAVTTDATCTEGGYTTHTCTLCGDSYTDGETGALGHSSSEGEVTLPTCTEGGYTTYLCGACEVTYTAEETEALGHAWGDWAVTTAATVEAEGQETRVCGTCGAEEKRAVAKLEPAPAEETTAPTEDPTVVAVQEMIDALPTSVNSEEEAEALEDAILAVDDALAELYTEQSNQLDYTNYVAALEALEEAFNTDWSKNVLEELYNKNGVILIKENDEYILEVKEGSAKGDALWAAFDTVMDAPNGVGRGYRLNSNDRKIVFNSNLLDYELDEGKLTVERGYSSGNYGLSTSYDSNTTFTVKVFHEISVSTTPANIGGVTYNGTSYGNGKTIKVYTGGSVTANDVDGYNKSVDGTVSNIAASGAVAVTYTEKAAPTHAVNLVIADAGKDYGTASLKVGNETIASGSAIAEGSVVTVVATPKSSDASNVAYYVDSITGVDTNNQFTVGNSDVTVTVTFAKVELNAFSSSIGMNGYYEGRISEKVFDTLKTDVLTAAGLTGVNPADYTVEAQAGNNYYNLDTITDWQHTAAKMAFFGAVEVPETGRKFIITKNASGNVPAVSATVTMDITESRDPAVIGDTLSETEFTVKTLDELKTEIAKAVTVTPSGATVTVALTGGDLTVDGTKFTATVTVDADGETWLENTTGKTFEITGKLQTYTITWDPANGSKATTTSVGHGLTPTAPETNPTKESTASTDYEFSGWDGPDDDTEVDAAFYPITDAVTYTARYTESARKYKITWIDGNGKTIYTEDVAYGETPAYNSEEYGTPAKISNDPAVVYSWKGWKPTEVPVTKEATYVADFTTDTVHVITFKVGGEVFGEVQYINVTENKDAKVTDPGTPDANNEIKDKIFTGWDADIIGKTPTKNMTVNAVLKDEANDNNVPDENETATIEVKTTGNGRVALTPAGKTTVTDNKNGTYTVLFDSTDDASKVITVTATPDDTGKQDVKNYVVSAPETVTVANGETSTVTVEFGVHTLSVAEDPQLKVNGYSTDTKLAGVTKKDVLEAVLGKTLSDAEVEQYDVKMHLELKFNVLNKEVDWSGYHDIWNFEVPEEYSLFKDLVESAVKSALERAIDVPDTELFQVTWKAHDQYPEITVTGVEVDLIESRAAAEVTHKEGVTYTASALNDELLNKIKANLTTNASFSSTALAWGGEYTLEPGTAVDVNVTVNLVDTETVYVENGGVYTVIVQVAVPYTQATVTISETAPMTYNTGMTDADKTKMVLEAVKPVYVPDPAEDQAVDATVWYLASEARNVPVTIDINALDLGNFNWLKNLLDNPVITVNVPVEEMWRNIGDDLTIPKAPSNERMAEVIKAVIEDLGMSALTGMTEEELKVKVKDELLKYDDVAAYYQYLGAHIFGENETKDAQGNVLETVYLTVSDYTVGEQNFGDLKSNECVLTLSDLRTETIIELNSGVSVVYGNYTEAELLGKLVKGVYAKGTEVEGAVVEFTTDVEGLPAAEEIGVTVKFAGNKDYKPSTATGTITVAKAPVQVNADHRRIKYGTAYEMPLTTTPAGVDMVHFIAGLDISDLNVNDKKLVGIMGSVQLLLPEELQSMLSAFDSVLAGQGLNVSFADGATMKLSDLKKASAALKEILQNTQFAAYTDALVKALDSLPTDVADITITIGGDLPTNIGAYIIGGITADANYETAVGAAVVVITPEGKKANIDWVNHDENHIFTNSLLTGSYLDAYVVSVAEGDIAEAEEQIIELFLGINVDGSIVLTRNETALNVGAYAEVALVANWGNEMYYSNILARPVVVIAESLDVEFVDQTGTVNNECLFEFDNTPKAMEDLLVTYKWDGDGYKAGDKVEEYNVTYLYAGAQSNGMPYVEKTAPVHAGVYTVTAIVTIGDGSAISHAGVGHGVLTITPTESDISVGNKAVKWDGSTYGMSDEIVATSKVAGLTPDTTIISAGLSADLDDVSGLNAINGTINVDMPAWLDELMKKLNILEAGYGDGIKAETFINYVDQIKAALIELGVEVAAFDEIVNFVQQIPVTTTLTFHDDASYSEIGAYLYVGIVTDSDHYPSVGAGVLVIYPDAMEAELKFEEDWNGNNIFTWQALENMNLEASAYVNGTYSAEATAKVVNLYFGFTDNGEFLLEAVVDGESLEGCEDFDNGAYTQLALLLDLGNSVYYAEPISRAFLIVPNPAVVEFVDENGNVNADRHFVFDNQPHEMPVRVTVNGTEVRNPAVTVRYAGVQTNGVLWNSEEAPKHAGCYTVTAIYTEQDAQDRYVTLGSAVGVMVIEPAEATMDVQSKVHVYDGSEIAVNSLITVTSAVERLNPDKTIITAAISTDGTFSENLMSAVTGSVNVDFPAWVDEILTVHAPSIYKGMKASEFNAKLIVKLNGIVENAEVFAAQYNIPAEELISTLTAAVETVEDVLNQMPGDVNLTFQDDVSYSAVGAYLVVGVVTDSDHYPAVDAGVLAIVPDADLVHLKWNYEDENNIWTRELLKKVDLYATAYHDKAYKNPYGDEAVISYRFIGIDSKGMLRMYDKAEDLPNGIYTEIAFVELEIGSKMVISDVIERAIVIMANMGGVEIVDDQNRAQNKFEYIYGDKVELYVTLNGEKVTNDIYYVGVNNHALPYADKTAPSDPGVYMASTVYKVTDDKGNVTNVGTDSAMVTIAPGENDMQVTGSTVTYDGKSHGVSTKDVTVSTGSATNANYTLISGGVSVSGNAEEIGIQALTGNVNVDFPAWVDDLMEEYGIDLYTKGTTPVTIKNFLNARTQEIVDLVPVEELVALGIAEADVNAAVEALTAPYKAIATLLNKLPQNVTLTYEDDVLYTEPGYYGYFGVITDLDEVPSADTGLLVIEKKELVYDLLDTTVTWDGESHMVEINNPENTDAVTLIIDRAKNTINIVLDEDAQYLLNKLAEILGVEFDGDVQISTIREQYNGEELAAAIVKLIGELEKLQLPEETDKAMAAVKAQLEKLPENGTVVINGILPAEVGKYEVYAITYAQYFKSVSSEAVLEILPVKVEVILDNNSKTYGDQDPALTHTVNYYNHENQKLEDAGIANISVSRAEGEDVGTYAITAQVTLTDDVHYVLAAEPEAAEFEILPREITVKADDKTKTYGEEDPDFTYTITEGTLVSGDVIDISIDRVSGEAVGKYTITATGTHKNYEIVFEEGILAINSREMTDKNVSLGDSLTYTGEAQTQMVIVKLGDKVLLEGVDYKVTGATQENAGSYKLAVEFMGNYTGTVEVDWSIAPKEITIVVNDAEKVEGEADPEFTATVSGAIQGKEPEVTLSRETGEAVNTYVINAEITDTNYTAKVTTGTLTIKAKTDDGKDDEDDKKTGFQVIIDEPNETIKANKTVEIDGVEYKLDESGELWITKETAEKWAQEGTKLLTTYVYKEDSSDVHKEYPTAMYVWVLTYECGSDNELETVRAVRIEELDNYLMYEGTSIRINFVNDAIRFFTSVTPDGYKGLKNGTLVKNTGTVLDGAAMLEMGTRAKKFDAADTSLTVANSAGDIVFGEHANDDGLATDGLRKYGDGTRAVTKEACYLFTGAMENLPTSKENLNLEFVVRPYVTLKLKNGETVTLYGGKYQRTISYVAYQNQTFMAGTAYNDYIQKIIKISGIDPKTGKIS